MADPTGYTAEALQELEAAAASGVLSVTMEGQVVTFNTLKDLQAQIAIMRRQLYPTNAPTHRFATTNKGV